MKLTRDLKEFIGLLNAHGVEYLLVGGWAFGFHATPRYTGDLDFFVRSNRENCEKPKVVLSEFGLEKLPDSKRVFLNGDELFSLACHRVELIFLLKFQASASPMRGNPAFTAPWKGCVCPSSVGNA
jgi:hypothetical protein